MDWARGCPCCAGMGGAPIAALPASSLGGGAPLSLIDTHNHVHRSWAAADDASGCRAAVLTRAAVLAVEESCWDRVLIHCSFDAAARPGFGVHPWFVHELADGWQTRLRAALLAHPHALVGEIGLCKCAKNLRGPGAKARVWPVQVDAFRTQLHLAASLQRPASVHCVKAHGTLLECLEAAPALPPAVALHSFSGSSHEVARLLRLDGAASRLFFGFSHTVNVAMGGGPGSAAHAALLEAIRAVPEAALLVESDVDEHARAPLATRLALQLVADARGWSVEHAAECTTSNALRFLRAGGGAERAATASQSVAFTVRATGARACEARVAIVY
jgi:TatD DNase family protein